MLNPSFKQNGISTGSCAYVAPRRISHKTLAGNEATTTGPETRLDGVYERIVWSKFKQMGLYPESFTGKTVLEVSAGTGFLTHHLLLRAYPKKLTVNDISYSELREHRRLIQSKFPTTPVDYLEGDLLKIESSTKYDFVIGNSFLHHLPNLPRALAHLQSLLKVGGTFVDLHEPTYMAPFLESRKSFVYPVAVFAPQFFLELARRRYRGPESETDIWLFDIESLRNIMFEAGFSTVSVYGLDLFKQVAEYQARSAHWHLGRLKGQRILARARRMDAWMAKVLAERFFGGFGIRAAC